MKTLAVGALIAGTGLVLAGGPSGPSLFPTGEEKGAVPSASSAPGSFAAAVAPAPPAALDGVVQRYCVVCHNDRILTGNLSLDSFAVERAEDKGEIAERMIRKLRAGMMPPPGMPRPAGDTLLML